MANSYGSTTSEELQKAREAIDLVNADAAANWDNPAWRNDMADAITEEVNQGFECENLLPLLTTVENVGFNDRLLIKETRGMRAFIVARGGYIEASTIHSEVMELQRATLGFHVWEMEDRLVTNFSETQGNLVSLGSQRMNCEVNRWLLSLFQAAVPDNTSTSYSATAGISLATVNAALTRVRDASRSRNVTIIGRASTTEQIFNNLLGAAGNGGGFLPTTNEDLIQRGVIGVYRGANIVTLTNYLDDQDLAFWPEDEMWIVGTDASKFGFFGGILNKEYSEQDNWYWHYLARRDFGAAVTRPDRLARLIDTNL